LYTDRLQPDMLFYCFKEHYNSNEHLDMLITAQLVSTCSH